MTVLRPRQRRGRTHTQTGSISITAPLETVWDLITTIATIPTWYDTWDTVEHDTADSRLRVNTLFRLRRRGDETARCGVTDLSAPTQLQWEQTSLDAPTLSVTFLLIPGATTGTTELRHTRTWTAP